MKESRIKCAFYGSLRKPMYNYSRFIKTYGLDSMRYKKTVKINGYELYNLGAYPGIKLTEKDKTIIVDLFEVTQDVYEVIYGMESGANYYEDDVIIDDTPYKIFIYLGWVSPSSLIESGDWLSQNNFNNLKNKTNDHIC